MNSVAVASKAPSLQPMTANANATNANALRSSPSAAVHAAMQRSAFGRQTNNANYSNGSNSMNANNQFVSRAAQMQMQQASYYAAPTRSRRAGSRDRAWTDTTTQQPTQPTASEMAAVLRPRVARPAMTSPQPLLPMQAASHHPQQHHYKQQQQFPTLVHHQPQRHAARPTQSQPTYQMPHQIQQRASPSMQQQYMQQQRLRTPPTTQSRTPPTSQRPQPAQQPPKTPPPAAVEWRVAVDPKSRRPYYYHPVTRQTSWKKPQELVDKEKHERASFFAAMESNIRAKLRDGNWFRDSLTSRPGDLDDIALVEEDTDDGELSSSTSTSSRSSWSSTTTASVASGPAAHKPRASQHHTRSLPASPEPKPAASNQDDHDALLLASAAKPPTLFRTLSSYETPVVGETKKLANGRVMAVPSPILERVRLAGMDENMPRSSDLEAYTRPDLSALESAPTSSETTTTDKDTVSRGIVRAPLRRRSNSTSTIYVRMGTMHKPDQDTTIQCIATVLRAHLMEAQAAPFPVDGKFEIFVNERDQRANTIPSLKDIGVFIKHIFARAQMESECIIMSLIYVERLLKATMGSLQLQPGNWRSILFCSMVMASKVWDDLSMCNADFSKIWPELSLKEINELELAYLSAVEYNVRVSAVSYAKYYFHLRSMCATMGMLESFDESAPLNLDGARKMQVLSEEYQERTKLLPTPSRRRSVTITTPSSAGADPRMAALTGGTTQTKWSPTASLEQLVQMQSRVAGGTSLATMHRLSSTSASSKA